MEIPQIRIKVVLPLTSLLGLKLRDIGKYWKSVTFLSFLPGVFSDLLSSFGLSAGSVALSATVVVEVKLRMKTKANAGTESRDRNSIVADFLWVLRVECLQFRWYSLL